jgi:hypothetical protein
MKMTRLEKFKELYHNVNMANDGLPEKCPDEYSGLNADCSLAMCFAPGQCERCWNKKWESDGNGKYE